MTRYITQGLFKFVATRRCSTGSSLVSRILGFHFQELDNDEKELIEAEVNKDFNYDEAKDLVEMQMMIWDAMYTRYKESSEKDKEKKRRLKVQMKFWEKTYDWYDKRLSRNGDDRKGWNDQDKAKFIFDGVHAFILTLYFVIKDRKFLLDRDKEREDTKLWESQIQHAKYAIQKLLKRIGELVRLKCRFSDGEMEAPPFDDEDTIMPLLSPRERNHDQVKGRQRLSSKTDDDPAVLESSVAHLLS